MPTPRITGLLHNCALNSALPNLLEGIEELAELELSGQLESLRNDPVYNNYKKLKTIFARHYGLASPENFSWSSFVTFLSAHAFYPKEIIFAPVFRTFIAEVALTQHYLSQDLGGIRDVQRTGTNAGTYIDLHYLEAATLFHNLFGITLNAYEFIGNKDTGDARDNYNLVQSKPATLESPLKASSLVNLFYKEGHFEIQPHELTEAANKAYEEEIQGLSPELHAIHDALSLSVNAYSTNRALGRLYLYVNQKLRQQLQQENKLRLRRDFVVTLEEYVDRGPEIHDIKTYAGRQTFAIILLHLNQSLEARELLTSLGNLAYAANGDVPLALHLSDQLATAVIASRMNLRNAELKDVIEQVHAHDKANNLVRTLEQPRFGWQAKKRYTVAEKRFLKSVDETIQLAWKTYKDTRDEFLLTIIAQTENLLLNPTLRNVRKYDQLREHISGKGSWGGIIAGAMLNLMGLALIVGTALTIAATFGTTLPLTAAVVGSGASALAIGITDIAVGISFFSSSKDKGLYKQMGKICEDGETYLAALK
jgi:hypothetical protein